MANRVHKKPVSEEQIYNWIKYSLRGLAMAKQLADKKGLDYRKISERAYSEIVEEFGDK